MTNTESDEVVLQGIEFWSSLCELEIDFRQEIEVNLICGLLQNLSNTYQIFWTNKFIFVDYFNQDSEQGDEVYFGFVQKNLSLVTPYLLQWLTRQAESDEEEWIPSKAAHVCLTLLAECVEVRAQ